MLEKAHINWYLEDILRARRTALQDIQTARLFAKDASCEGCEFCNYLLRHEEILGRTAADLVLIVDSLSEGKRANFNFPKIYTHDTIIYRGFIAEDGSYLCVGGEEDHDHYKEKYIEEHGKERSYRLIKVSSSYGTVNKAQVLFSDRKLPPSQEQYKTLRNLMIEAEGKLSFCFVYDPSHPN